MGGRGRGGRGRGRGAYKPIPFVGGETQKWQDTLGMNQQGYNQGQQQQGYDQNQPAYQTQQGNSQAPVGYNQNQGYPQGQGQQGFNQGYNDQQNYDSSYHNQGYVQNSTNNGAGWQSNQANYTTQSPAPPLKRKQPPAPVPALPIKKIYDSTARVEKLLDGKNAVSALHETYQVQPSAFYFEPVRNPAIRSKIDSFICTITYEGSSYEGQGVTKKEAKCSAAKQMLEKKGWTPDNKPVEASSGRAENKNYQRLMQIYGVGMMVDTSEDGPPFTVSVSLPYVDTPFVGQGPSKTRARGEACGAACKAIDSGELKTPEPVKPTTFDPEQNEAMNKFNSWVLECGTVAQWEVDYDGPPYLASVRFPDCEKVFKDYGVNRRTAKYNVARLVLEALQEGKFGPPPRQKPAPLEHVMINITSPEECLKLLNELFHTGDVVWSYEQTIVAGKFEHQATALVQEHNFTASASTKKAARQQVAVDIIQALNECSMRPTKQRGQKRKRGESADYEDGEEQPKMRRKDGVSLILEMYGNTLKFNYNTFGTGTSAYSTCAVELNGRVFEAKGSNKKTARHLVANMIVDAIDSGQIIPPKSVNMYVTEAKAKASQATTMKPPKEKLTDETSTVTVYDMFGTLDFEYDGDQNGQIHASITIADQTFTAIGDTAYKARIQVSDKIIQAVEAEKLEKPEPKTTMTEEDKAFLAKCNTMFRDHVMWKFDVNDQHMVTARSWYQAMDFIDTGVTKIDAMVKVWAQMLAAHDEQKITVPETKNALALLNELFNVENRVVQVQSTGPIHAPAFTAVYTVKGDEYVGMSGSKKDARLKAAQEVMKAVECGKLEPDHLFDPTAPKNIKSASRSQQPKKLVVASEPENATQKVHILFNKDVVFEYEELSVTPHLFKCVATVSEKIFTGEGQNKKEARFATCRAILDAVDKGDIKSMRDRDYTAAVSLKGQCDKAGLTLEHKDLDKIVNGKQKIFRVAAVIDGKEYIGSGLSLKKAKGNANSLALAEKFNIHSKDLASEELKSMPDFEAGDVGNMNPHTLSNTVQRLVQEHYTSAVKDLEYNLKQRKVLAGCVQTVEDDIKTAKVITVAAGTKCIDGSMLSTQGISLNDMHAEILVKRVMKVYLMEQLEKLTNKEESIFQMPGDKRKKTPLLKPGVRFHLYISSPPCGDSRLFSVSDENQQTTDPSFVEDEKLGDRNPNRHNRGLLRVKCEAGEGTIPVNSENIVNLQTYDGVVSGERLQIMSCSDKVARTTILGIQGALLSRIIAPIYYSSITIGSLYNPQHLYRGLYGRFSGVKGDLAGGFWAQPPAILGVYSEELRNKAKAPSHAVVSYDNWLEVIKTVNGKIHESNQPSRLSKRELFLRFRDMFKMVKKQECEEVYSEAKSAAQAYQNNKKILSEFAVKSGIGAWNKVPPELDQFNRTTAVAAEAPQDPATKMETS